MAKIYLSSTFSDLEMHRASVYRALRKMRHDVVSMEDYAATGRPPLEKCLADVAACDVYVGLLAFRYGYVPPDEEQSITELEFRCAQSSGKTCLLFLMAEDAPVPANMVDRDRTAVDRLRAEVQRDFVVQYFRTPDDLAAAVSVAVANALAAPGERDQAGRVKPDPESRRFYCQCLERFTKELGSQIRLYSMGSAVLALGGVALLAAGLAYGQLPIGLGGALVGSTTAFPLVTLLSCRRQKVLLEGYETELRHETPAAEALRAVQRFLDRQVTNPALT